MYVVFWWNRLENEMFSLVKLRKSQVLLLDSFSKTHRYKVLPFPWDFTIASGAGVLSTTGSI